MTDQPKKHSPEAESITEAIVRRALAIAGAPIFGDRGRAELIAAVKRDLANGWQDERLAIERGDLVVFDLQLDGVVADLVVVHADSSVTVVVLRNGDDGREHVRSGIKSVTAIVGKVALKCAASSVRPALLWTSCGDPTDDAALEALCEEAGVLPLPHGRLAVLAAVPEATQQVLEGRAT